MVDADFYNEDYYERGLETGKSCYSNYRWMPDFTIPMAMTIIDRLSIAKNQTILDYGCSKGYMVKAFRMLHRKAWGIDTSAYAIKNTDPEVKKYCSGYVHTKMPAVFDFCIAKDVFEHIPKLQIVRTLKNIPANKLFAVIPMGKDGKYTAPANNHDLSHVLCEDNNWWVEMFKETGWNLLDFTYKIDGIKDSYYKSYPEAHGFFTLIKGRK